MEIKVGYLVPITVVKALPDYRSYLTLIMGTELMAILPKDRANKIYRVGDSTLASIFAIHEGRIFLSQKSAQYFRKLLELLLSPLLQAGKVEVKKAAVSSNFAKVAIAGLNGDDPVGYALPYLKDLKQYTPDTVTLVKFSENLKEYVVNALVPAPRERVKKVIHFQTLREVLVTVEPSFVGKFLGKGGMNVVTASKLVGTAIKIEPEMI